MREYAALIAPEPFPRAVLDAVPRRRAHRVDELGTSCRLMARVLRNDVAELVTDDLVGDRIPLHRDRLLKCFGDELIFAFRVSGVRNQLVDRLDGALVLMILENQVLVADACSERTEVVRGSTLGQALVQRD